MRAQAAVGPRVVFRPRPGRGTAARVKLAAGMLLLATAGAHAAAVVDRNGDGRVVVACVGDSNTDELLPLRGGPKWCTVLGAAPDRVVVNLAIGGAFARPGADWDGPGQVRRAWAYHPDAVVIALGTNDVRVGRSADAVIAALEDLEHRALAFSVAVWVATIPPNYEPGWDSTREGVRRVVNATLRSIHPTSTLEFDEGFDRADFTRDGLHLSAAGQARRARIAAACLFPSP
jgi:lysophospholipase L1-like esterase